MQRAPELFLALKAAVDSDRKPGRFFLAGSANVLTLTKRADSLTGPMELVTLWPLSQGEVRHKQESFIDLLFSSKNLPKVEMEPLSEMVGYIVRSGYPEVLHRDVENAVEPGSIPI